MGEELSGIITDLSKIKIALAGSIEVQKELAYCMKALAGPTYGPEVSDPDEA